MHKKSYDGALSKIMLFDVLVLILLTKFVPNSTIRAVPISIRLNSNEPIKKNDTENYYNSKKSFCFSNIEKLNNLIVHKKSISCFLCKFELRTENCLQNQTYFLRQKICAYKREN